MVCSTALLLKLTYYARENYSWNSTRQRENVKEPTTDGHNDRQRQETVRGQVVLFIADWSWECHQLGLTNNSSDSCWITQRRVRIRIATRIMKRNFHFIVSHVTPNKLQQLRIRSRQSGMEWWIVYSSASRCGINFCTLTQHVVYSRAHRPCAQPSIIIIMQVKVVYGHKNGLTGIPLQQMQI